MRLLVIHSLGLAALCAGCGRGETEAKVTTTTLEALAPPRIRKMTPAQPVAAEVPMVAPAVLEELARTLSLAKADGRAEILHRVASGALPPELFSPLVLQIAQNGHDKLQQEAISALGLLPPNQENVDALLVLAHDGKAETRTTALRALGKAAPDSAKVKVTLRKALHDEKAEVRLAALQAVARQGSGALPEMLKALQSPDESFRLTAIATLRELGPEAEEAGDTLLRLCRNDPVEQVRHAAQAALQRIDPAAVEQ
jgi:HEAT repeat protein